MMAMLAVFDTQVLSIFRRQKEIGTYVALGMTRGQVVKLFTIEGAMHSVLAALVAAVYGIPLLALQAIRGISIPVESKDFGIAMAAKLYPVYSLALICRYSYHCTACDNNCQLLAFTKNSAIKSH